jgi:membrane-associated phospholipid phosphatase
MARRHALPAVLAGAALAVGVALPAWAAPAARPASQAARQRAAGPFAPGSGQPVVDWNKTLITILGTPGAQPATIHPTRSFAILQAAEYDAVVSVTRVGRPYLFRVHVHGRASAAAAADQAAHDVLAGLYPAQAGLADSQLATELATVPAGPARDLGITIGQRVAAKLLAIRSADGSALTPPPFTPGTAPGDYQPTPPAFAPPVFTNWGNITPFVLVSGSQFRPPAPPPVTSTAYQQALATTESLGQDTSTTRTADQTAAGEFWSAGPIWNVWNEIAQDQASARQSSLQGAATMFAALDLALADTAIGLYDAKYHYQVWRPITAIRDGAEFGFPANPGWNPLTTTAPDPSYPGAHSGFSFAAATVLTAFFGGDQPVTVHQDALPGQTRGFADFFSAATEAALSRIWAGQHTSFDDQAGRTLGADTGWFVLRHFDPFLAAHTARPRHS